MLYIDDCPIHSLTSDQREKIGDENREFQLDLTGDPTTPQFAVVDPFGKLIASQGGYLKSGEFIAFLETAESAYRLRSGAARCPSWPVWVLGSFLIAVACLVAIRARTVGRTREEQGPYDFLPPEPGVAISAGHTGGSILGFFPSRAPREPFADRPEPVGNDACLFLAGVSGGACSSAGRFQDG